MQYSSVVNDDNVTTSYVFSICESCDVDITPDAIKIETKRCLLLSVIINGRQSQTTEHVVKGQQETMPEGPECYKYARSLNNTLAGHELVAIHILGGRYAKHGKPENLDTLEESIHSSDDGVTVKDVGCKGKLIYFNLSNQMTLLSTLGLMGKWTNYKSKHCGLAIEHRKPTTTAAAERSAKPGSKMLYFKDQIHYGTFSVIMTNDLPKKLKTLGIDVLDHSAMTWDAFLVRARRNSKNTLPVFLMKQNVLCGIGNYLKAEIIYDARASVSSPIADYTDEQLKRVYEACRRIPYECTFGKYRLCVYNRKRDRLGNAVYTIRTPDKRTTYWVPAVCPIDITTDRPAVETVGQHQYGEEAKGGDSGDDCDDSDTTTSTECGSDEESGQEREREHENERERDPRAKYEDELV